MPKNFFVYILEMTPECDFMITLNMNALYRSVIDARNEENFFQLTDLSLVGITGKYLAIRRHLEI